MESIRQCLGYNKPKHLNINEKMNYLYGRLEYLEKKKENMDIESYKKLYNYYLNKIIKIENGGK